MAAVAPTESRTTQPALSDVPRLLQAELKRVGCKTGDVDGEWNASARKALTAFNASAGTKLDVKVASIDALDTVKSKTGRVCPLECERGFRASGDQCVQISCDDGYVLGPNNACVKRPPAVTQRERAAPPSGKRGGKCFVYGGTSFCE